MGCDPGEVLLATARSLGAVQAVEAWRRAPYGSWPQSICVLTGMRAVLARLRGSLDRLLALAHRVPCAAPRDVPNDVGSNSGATTTRFLAGRPRRRVSEGEPLVAARRCYRVELTDGCKESR